MNLLYNNRRRKILDTYVSDLSLDETVEEIIHCIDERRSIQHVVINANKVVLLKDNEELRDIVNHCTIINADGISIYWAAKLLGISLRERVTGIDLFQKLMEVADRKEYKVFLFGAKEETVLKVKNYFESKYKNLNVVGYRNGYFEDVDNREIVKKMRESGADMLFVAFPSPQKEFWINKYKEKINIPFIMGVGGSFDVIAGEKKRAPKIIQKMGFEWLFRFVQEPRRMFKRNAVGSIRFVYYVIKEKILQIKRGRE